MSGTRCSSIRAPGRLRCRRRSTNRSGPGSFAAESPCSSTNAAISNVAARIAAGDFSHRLDEETGGDEFALLAAAINAMLERIEELVEQLRLVTDSLAHDLRSPLTRMRANMERAASGGQSERQQ